MVKSDFYTGHGDRGDTGRLMGEGRIAKNSLLIEALGTLDEASSAIGLARAVAQSDGGKQVLITVQRHLYRLMSHLSAVPEARPQYPGLAEAEVAWLEETIAQMESKLPVLKDFVLPGESYSGAACHAARTVVRRAERRVVSATEAEADFAAPNLVYLNRLSSLLFVLALQEDRWSGQALRLAHDAA